MRRQIAYVEDDPVILANYTGMLAAEGFEVLPLASKEDALAAFREALPDLALLDVSLHGERDAGFELCSEPGAVKSHRELMKACNIVVEANTITAHVRAIRAAFKQVDPAFDAIKTERGSIMAARTRRTPNPRAVRPGRPRRRSR